MRQPNWSTACSWLICRRLRTVADQNSKCQLPRRNRNSQAGTGSRKESMADIINDENTAVLEPPEAEQQLQIPDELPLLPLRDIVIYPFMIVPLFVSREKSIRAVDEALGEHRMILLTCQKDLDKEEPQQDDLYSVGTVAVIMRMLKLPDGRIRI